MRSLAVRLSQNRCFLLLCACIAALTLKFMFSEYSEDYIFNTKDKEDENELVVENAFYEHNSNQFIQQQNEQQQQQYQYQYQQQQQQQQQSTIIETIPSDPLYFANELALHTELIDNSYADDFERRQANFDQDLIEFEKIGRDLLHGKLDTFKHISRYYAHPSKYNEYKREWIINKWENKESHISNKELNIGHPSCPVINNENDIINNNINTIELHFTHNCCKRTQPPHEKTAYDIGKWKQVIHYTMHNLTYDFYNKNKHILTQGRGGGYWLWKPYSILDALINHAKPCDIVCYCDTGAWWNNTAFPLWELSSKIKYGVMAFNHLLADWKYVNITERWYSKRDAFILLGVDYYDMYDTIIRKATFSCYQKNPDSIHFVNEWLYHSQDERIITDIDNTFNINNIPHFSVNRHDQTVFSLISKKYGIPAFIDVSQYGYADVRRWGNIVKHWEKPWIVKHTRGKQ